MPHLKKDHSYDIYFFGNKKSNIYMHLICKICLIVVYLFKYYFESHLTYKHILVTNNLQSIEYYGTLRRYNWSMP